MRRGIDPRGRRERKSQSGGHSGLSETWFPGAASRRTMGSARRSGSAENSRPRKVRDTVPRPKVEKRLGRFSQGECLCAKDDQGVADRASRRCPTESRG
jgi:hypothetical protein